MRYTRIDDKGADLVGAPVTNEEMSRHMEFILTEHAKKRLTQRKIPIEWVQAALKRPLRTENDHEDPELAHALLYIPERFKLLRVIYKETTNPPFIVTAYLEEADRHET